jgi:hypothetical protein
MHHERNTYSTSSQTPLRTAFEPGSTEPPGVSERGDVQRPNTRGQVSGRTGGGVAGGGTRTLRHRQ